MYVVDYYVMQDVLRPTSKEFNSLEKAQAFALPCGGLVSGPFPAAEPGVIYEYDYP